MTSVLDNVLLEVISVTPAMRPSERSRGVATVAAMVSGPAPGSLARTITTGKSTCGKGATGNRPKATMPARAMANVSKAVATGRRMKGAERLAGSASGPKRCLRPCSSRALSLLARPGRACPSGLTGVAALSACSAERPCRGGFSASCRSVLMAGPLAVTCSGLRFLPALPRWLPYGP